MVRGTSSYSSDSIQGHGVSSVADSDGSNPSSFVRTVYVFLCSDILSLIIIIVIGFCVANYTGDGSGSG